ncbi:L-aspartate oxidase [Heliorestis acidaminivorans]|uniref:L-aspartate oxidase n=1 Tax=Heliorestis acidaminivorans TaxID=553427 RepID=A0A6I0F022_9FIRM|nr:L-aspartate oxidase [Heliorestis acidaminivorans]KAB2953085.1 L-aspartate oxidase [Heliorestis acidaminivorans]
MTSRYLVEFDHSKLTAYETDFLIVGSGIAGLYTALKAVAYGRVTILTKRKVSDSNTQLAQGGIAAAIGRRDSPTLHLQDTLTAGAGLNDISAVKVMVSEGPGRVEELIQMGTQFDTVEGALALTREGAHSRRRILHASGDATGEEIRRSLLDQCRKHKDINILEDTQVSDILLNRQGQCFGVVAWHAEKGLHSFYSAVTVLATGGNGQLYKYSTNPEVTTGDGIAAAFRAGAELMDLEFIQFHPTALTKEGIPPFLISEAVRGEGAQLLNSEGIRFMPKYHQLAELAPRDVVALAIWKEMMNTGAPSVFLDLSTIKSNDFASRFPVIYKTCRSFGINVPEEKIPVAPAAHYLMGGVRTDINGRTNIARLFACGEAACNGVHGANRLASNSLLEGLVFGSHIVEAARPWLKEKPDYCLETLSTGSAIYDTLPTGEAPWEADEVAQRIQKVMWESVGLWRSSDTLEKAAQELEIVDLQQASRGNVSRAFEAANMLLLGKLTVRAAELRKESRGGHYRVDEPESKSLWLRHIVQVL